MALYVQLTLQKKKWQLLQLKGFQHANSAKKVICYHFTIAIEFKLQHKTGDVERRAKSGQKKVITKPEDQYLKEMCLRDLYASAPDLKVESENACNVNISA